MGVGVCRDRTVFWRPAPNVSGMPVVTVTMARGRSYEQKKRMAEEIAGTVSRILAVPPERVTILIHELEKENIAIAGTLLSEQQK